MTNLSPAFYTVKDSLGNLRIKVRLERTQATAGCAAPSLGAFLRHRSSIAGLGEEGESQWQQSRYDQQHVEVDRETEEHTFKWQEKILSQMAGSDRWQHGTFGKYALFWKCTDNGQCCNIVSSRYGEFILYGNEANCDNVLQRQYHEDIMRLRQSGGRATKRLFSYIEGDEYGAIEDRIENITIGDGKPSFLVDKMASVRHRRVAPRPQGRANIYQDPIIDTPTSEAKKKAHTLPQFKQTFRIMADLGPRDAASPDPKDEQVICTIRVFNDNLLSIEPDFNYQTKQPYRIKSRLGDFQYTLEHASPKLTFDDLEAQRKADTSLNEYRTSVLKTQMGTEFDVPEEGVLKVFYFGEILTAKHFEYDNLLVHYFVELPRGWYCATGPTGLWGISQTCRTADIDKDDMAYFSCPFELELCCNESHYEAESPAHFTRWPQMFFEVLSRDAWNQYRTEGYGYHTLPTAPGVSSHKVNTWRPLSGGGQGELRRFFIGGLEELDELDYTRIPKGFEGNKLSKFGFQTKSAGVLTTRFYTAFQSRNFVSTERQQQLRYGALLEKISASVGMHSSIISVLEAFQRARQRMIAVRDNIYAEQGLFPA